MSYDWNETELRLIEQFMANGYTRAEAERRIAEDLKDAAEEDGYDGP